MSKATKTIQQGSDEYLRLVSLVAAVPHGEMIEYQAVQARTGVKMDSKGKSRLRRAILRCGREYAVLPQVGYKMAQADMAMGILTHQLGRIDNRVKRADRAQKVIQKDFYEQLGPDEQKGVLFVGAIFGAIRTSADKGRKLYAPPSVRQLAESNPIVP